MTRAERLMFFAAAFALGAGALLLEVLAYRLSAAVLGPSFASLVGLCMPGAAAAGAVLLRGNDAIADRKLARRGAHLIAVAGAAVCAGAIGFGWVSQVAAENDGDASWIHVFLGMASWLVPAFFTGAAIAATVRLGLAVVGRIGALEALGAAAACLLLSLLPTIGAPRAALGVGLLYAGAAVLLARGAQAARPAWSFLLTFPITLVVLLVGDISAPWMQMRTDVGRRTRVAYQHWTTEGVIAVDEVDQGRTALAVDRSRKMSLATDQPPSFAGQDVVYSIDASVPGPVLVIGSTGGRDVKKALAHDHAAVDAIELHPALVNHIMGSRYSDIAGHLLANDRVRIAVGQAAAVAATLPRERYQRVIVMGEVPFVHTAPRLLMQHDRLFTADALSIYLDRLKDGGSLVARVRTQALAGLLGTSAAALGAEEARRRTFACTTTTHSAIVVIHAGRLSSRDTDDLVTACNQFKMTVVSPESPDGWAATDDRPFLQAPPPPSALVEATVSALRSLDPPDARLKTAQEVHQAPIAAAALVVLLVIVSLLFVVPRGSIRTPSRVALALFGAALSMCTFALVDRLLLASGHSAVAWSLLIPMGLVGVGLGRLWLDVVSRDRLRAHAPWIMGLGVVWLILAELGTRWIPDGMTIVVAGGAPLLLLSGGFLGAPLYASLGVWATRPSSVGAALGVHHAGWGAGGAAAILLAHYAGLSWIMPAGVAAYVAASGLWLFDLRRRAA